MGFQGAEEMTIDAYTFNGSRNIFQAEFGVLEDLEDLLPAQMAGSLCSAGARRMPRICQSRLMTCSWKKRMPLFPHSPKGAIKKAGFGAPLFCCAMK
jgi:hypothetical protein